jgi:peptidoglycan/xylan/chitin deacetylase (PgdA/CDA1 family)
MTVRRSVVGLLVAFASIVTSGARPQQPDRVVAITIDDLPIVAGSVIGDWANVTDRLLAALRRQRATAVGFVNESKLYRNGTLDSTRVALLRSWLAAGHELGNHTFAHRSAHTTPLDEYLAGIARGEVVTRPLDERAGRPLRYFRHPFLHAGRSLAFRRAVERFLAARGYTIAPVTVDNQEWVYARAYVVARGRDDTALVRRIVADYLQHVDSAVAYSAGLSRTLFGREIPLVLLLHANELNADYLDTVLVRLRANGYRFATLESVLRDSAYRSADTYVGPAGMSWLIRWAFTRGIRIPSEPREQTYVQALLGQR